MFAEIVAVVLAVVAVGAYFERKALKADIVLAEGRVKAAVGRVMPFVRAGQAQLKAEIADHVEKVIAEAKAEAEKIEGEAKADVSSVEGRVKTLVASIETSIKKAL
jgi:regulator of protease activity HflC (stomatin/prohibitin superfamily)